MSFAHSYFPTSYFPGRYFPPLEDAETGAALLGLYSAPGSGYPDGVEVNSWDWEYPEEVKLPPPLLDVDGEQVALLVVALMAVKALPS